MSTPVLGGVLCAAFIITAAVCIARTRRDRARRSAAHRPGCPCHPCRVLADLMQRDIDQALTMTAGPPSVPLRLIHGGAQRFPAPDSGQDGAA